VVDPLFTRPRVVSLLRYYAVPGPRARFVPECGRKLGEELSTITCSSLSACAKSACERGRSPGRTPQPDNKLEPAC
jgi:hypothetical protein